MVCEVLFNHTNPEPLSQLSVMRSSNPRYSRMKSLQCVSTFIMKALLSSCTNTTKENKQETSVFVFVKVVQHQLLISSSPRLLGSSAPCVLRALQVKSS